MFNTRKNFLDKLLEAAVNILMRMEILNSDSQPLSNTKQVQALAWLGNGYFEVTCFLASEPFIVKGRVLKKSIFSRLGLIIDIEVQEISIDAPHCRGMRTVLYPE